MNSFHLINKIISRPRPIYKVNLLSSFLQLNKEHFLIKYPLYNEYWQGRQYIVCIPLKQNSLKKFIILKIFIYQSRTWNLLIDFMFNVTPKNCLLTFYRHIDFTGKIYKAYALLQTKLMVCIYIWLWKYFTFHLS